MRSMVSGSSALQRTRGFTSALLLTSVVAAWSCTSVATDPPVDARNGSSGDGAPANVSSTGRARFEPEDGRVLHFAGGTVGQDDAIATYTRMTGPERAPMGIAMWMSVPGTRPYNMSLRRLSGILDQAKQLGQALNLTIDFRHADVAGFSSAKDKEFVESDVYDDLVLQTARLIHSKEVPVLLRIGGELNGEWEGLHPYVFPRAYRKFVELFRSVGVDHVAFVWCVEARGDEALEEYDSAGNPRWYPGDEWVDWLGLDVFAVQHFDERSAARTGRGRGAAETTITQTLLRMAREKKKPVLIGETTPMNMNIPVAERDPKGIRGQAICDTWFVPFSRFLDAHPEIKGVTMLSVDWTKTKEWTTWGDARIHNNPRVSEVWKQELDRARWIHLPDWRAQNGYVAPPVDSNPQRRRG